MKKVVLLSLVVLSMSAYADTTGNNLIQGYRAYIKANDGTSSLSGSEMYHGAYYQGFVNATADITSGRIWCTSGEAVINAQLYDVVGQYLSTHPEKRSQEGISIIQDALSTAFPCPK